MGWAAAAMRGQSMQKHDQKQDILIRGNSELLFGKPPRRLGKESTMTVTLGLDLKLPLTPAVARGIDPGEEQGYV